MKSFGKMMRARRSPWLATLVLALLPAGVHAQEPLGAEVSERPELRQRAAQLHAMVQSRARIGVVLGDAREVRGRTGVVVEQVVEGGPAARAGVRTGDVLLSMNDVPLGSRPGRRLTALMTEVEPGDTVTIHLHRDGQDQTVRVIPDRGAGAIFRTRDVVRPQAPHFDPGPIVTERIRELRPMFGAIGRHRLDLVAMNPRLGRYFGVDEGVLVADVPPESRLGLEPGDVIVSIDGRAVQDAAHARSILGSYRAGEEAQIQVVRDRRTITVRGTPDRSAR